MRKTRSVLVSCPSPSSFHAVLVSCPSEEPWAIPTTDADVSAPCGYHKVVLYGRTKLITLGGDHHWIVQAPDGSWTSKEGAPGPVVGLTGHPKDQWWWGFDSTYLGMWLIKGPGRASMDDMDHAANESEKLANGTWQA